MASKPIVVQPNNATDSYTFNNHWHKSFFGSFTPCSRASFACFCHACYVAKISDRVGEHFLTCCINPYALMAIRTKVRTAFHIRGSLIEDYYTTCCCVSPCAATQIEKELDFQGIPNKQAKH